MFFSIHRMEELLREVLLYPVMKDGTLVNVGCLGSKKYIVVQSRFMNTDVCTLQDLDWTMISFFQIKDDSWIKLPSNLQYGRLRLGKDVLLSGGEPVIKNGVDVGMLYRAFDFEVVILNDPKVKLGGRQYHRNNTLYKCIETFRCVIKKY